MIKGSLSQVEKTTQLKALAGHVALHAEVTSRGDIRIKMFQGGSGCVTLDNAAHARDVIALLQMMLTEAERLGKKPQ